MSEISSHPVDRYKLAVHDLSALVGTISSTLHLSTPMTKRADSLKPPSQHHPLPPSHLTDDLDRTPPPMTFKRPPIIMISLRGCRVYIPLAHSRMRSVAPILTLPPHLEMHRMSYPSSAYRNHGFVALLLSCQSECRFAGALSSLSVLVCESFTGSSYGNRWGF